MKIIFLGLGSIGKRHADILRNGYHHELFAFRSDPDSKKNEFDIKEIFSWEELSKLKPHIAFITNPTSLHIETAIKCAKLGCSLFVEKPLGANSKNLDELLQIVQQNKIVTYVAYNMRFHPVIQRIKKDYIDKYAFFDMRVVCTSFLPDWRPETSFKKNYSARSDLGGGVILDLSHEIDYSRYLLGNIKEIKGTFDRRADITVDTEDYSDILLLTEKGPVNIHINFLSQIRQRKIEIDFDGISIIGDLINFSISEYQSSKLTKSYHLEKDYNACYKEQIRYFLNNVENLHMMNNIFDSSSLFKKIISFKQKGYYNE